MKRLTLAAILALSAVLSGCVGTTVTKSPELNMVTVENSGCFLFCCIPLFSGDPDYPNQQVCNWFENTVKLETNIKLLNQIVAEEGARSVRNVVSVKDDENVLIFILKRKNYRTSAELVR